MVCDFTDAQATMRAIRAAGADVVVHTQALSDVDRCEQAPEEAERQNVLTVQHLCQALEGLPTWLVGMSTDYVFDGLKGQPYDERDVPAPLSVYGRSKLAAEQQVQRYRQGIVVRVSTLFGADRMNFCNAIVERLHRREPVQAFVDQTTSPTYTEDVADGMEALIRYFMEAPSTAAMPRVYHMTNRGGCRRIEFATEVARLLGEDASLIHGIPIQAQHRPAPRPAYSALTSCHLQDVIGRTLRPWQDALRVYLASQHWLN